MSGKALGMEFTIEEWLHQAAALKENKGVGELIHRG
jgi:hypothetical protein